MIGLTLCMSLIAFAAVGAATSLAILPVIRRVASGVDRSSRALGALRLLPSLFAAAVTGLWVLPGFVWLEPRDSGERVTPAIGALAILAGVVIASGFLRGARGLVATRALVARWRAGAVSIDGTGLAAPAFAVDDPFPVVAVAGILKPRIYVARSVLHALTPDELAAVLEHEAAHLGRRDNLARFLLRSCPDPLGWSRTGADLERAFGDAAERESDAAVSPGERRLDLASALVKVARLAAGRLLAPAAAAAFYRGDPIADRVHRLLDPPPEAGRPTPRRRFGVALALAVATLLVAGVQPTLLRDAHGVTERFVQFLQ